MLGMQRQLTQIFQAIDVPDHVLLALIALSTMISWSKSSSQGYFANTCGLELSTAERLTTFAS